MLDDGFKEEEGLVALQWGWPAARTDPATSKLGADALCWDLVNLTKSFKIQYAYA